MEQICSAFQPNKKTLNIDEIRPEDIQEIDNAVIWQNRYKDTTFIGLSEERMFMII